VRFTSLLQAVLRPSAFLLAVLVAHPRPVPSAAAQTAALSAALPPKPELKHRRKITTVYEPERLAGTGVPNGGLGTIGSG